MQKPKPQTEFAGATDLALTDLLTAEVKRAIPALKN
jgi:hypothetical protein